MKLKAVMENVDDLPEPVRQLYTERDGRWELTGIEGVKTEEDLARVKRALDHEKTNHADTRAKNATTVSMRDLDRLLDQKVDPFDASYLAPLLDEHGAALKAREDELETQRQAVLEEALDHAMARHRVTRSARSDILLAIREEDVEQTHIDGWLAQRRLDRPHWFGPTRGGGARPPANSFSSGPNPWSRRDWNMTEQSTIIRDKGMDHATMLARSAGHRSPLGATKRNAR